MNTSGGMRADTPVAGAVISLAGGRIPLCFTYLKTFNACIRMFFVLVSLFGGLYFVQDFRPLFGEGFSQTALFTVLLSLLQCMSSSSPLLIIRPHAAFFLIYIYTSNYKKSLVLHE